MRAAGIGLLILTGCVGGSPAARLESTARPAVVETCAEVRGSRVGELPLELQLGGATVSIREWTLADEEATSAIGFLATVPAGVTWHVRAGDEVFSGTGGRWLHPRGFGGPRVHGIDGITFCRVAPATSDKPVLAAR